MKTHPLLIAVLLASASLPAFAVEFSAKSVVSVPQQGEQESRLFVGAHALRRESQRGEQPIVELLDTQSQRMQLLIPARHTYMERPLPPGVALPGRLADADPCQNGVPAGASCRLLGEEMVLGRRALKWSITATHEGKQVELMQWNDSQHHFPIRQELEGKSLLEQRYIGNESLEGRSVERWEVVSSSPDGTALKVVRWYDPELNMPLREEMSNGYKQYLTEIQVGPQAAELFSVPADYSRVEPPALPQGGPAARP